LDPAVAPSADERRGLESLLQDQHRYRDDHYMAFRQHWYELKARDFRQELLDALADAEKQ